MSKARNLAGFAGSISSNNDLNVGIVTATSFFGDGSGLTGVGIGTDGSVNTVGIITASSFVGNVTGNATGLSGTPNVVLGIATVSAGTTSAPSITPTGDSNTGVFFPSADTIAFAEGGVEASRFDSSGRLLLGTTSASVIDSVVYPAFQINRPSSTGLNASILIRETELGTGFPRLIINKNRANNVMQTDNKLGSVDFYGDDGSSDVLAGRVEVTAVSNWSTGSYYGTRFAVSTVFTNTLEEKFRVAGNGGTFIWGGSTGADLLHLASRAAAGTGNYIIRGGYSSTGPGDTGTQCFYVYSNGNVANANNSYTAISDIKLKENIVDASSQWNDIKDLQVRNYNFKEGQTHTQIGLIAQEVELVSPGLVYESPDRDAEGNDLGTVTKSVNYSVLYMKAVKALQEAMERIETLEASNTDLLARVTALETP